MKTDTCTCISVISTDCHSNTTLTTHPQQRGEPHTLIYKSTLICVHMHQPNYIAQCTPLAIPTITKLTILTRIPTPKSQTGSQDVHPYPQTVYTTVCALYIQWWIHRSFPFILCSPLRQTVAYSCVVTCGP